MYEERKNDFDIVTFPVLAGDVHSATSCAIYTSQLIRFARASSQVSEFNNRNQFQLLNFLSKGYRYHKLRTTVSKFYCLHSE